MIRCSILGVLIVFAAVKLTHAVPAPSDVSVKCDSYGVVVDWTAAGFSQEAEFCLEIKPNFGEIIFVCTKDRRYNITALLDDPAYNMYRLKVKARVGEQESAFAKPLTFSFNDVMAVNVTCALEFPPVALLPRDGKLFVQFVNPLHLYRTTPALRNLSRAVMLQYVLASNKISQELSCSVESKTCESNISFPEEQDEYCVTLVGLVRQTLIRQSDPQCYSGPLYPALPVTAYLIPPLAASAAFVILALVSVLVVKKVNRIIKKKNLSKLPSCLNKMPFTPLIMPLKPEQETVDENPRVEPEVELTLDMTCDLEESTGQTNVTRPTDSIPLAIDPGDDDVCKLSDGSDYRNSWNTYGNAADLSSSDYSASYDQSHWRP